MKDAEKPPAWIRRSLDRMKQLEKDFRRRKDEAIERFRKKSGPKVNKGADSEYELQLDAAQIGIRTALAAGSWFFETKERAALSALTHEEATIYGDPTGLFKARAVIEAAKQGDRFARHALHNKLILEIDDDFPIIEEYKEYLIWLLQSTQEGKRRRGRHPKLNHARDKWICEAASIAMSHGFRLTRNRASDKPSAASLVAEALAEFGIHMTEANVELIAKNARPKTSEE